MRKLVFALITFSAIMALTYVGCSGEGGTTVKDGGTGGNGGGSDTGNGGNGGSPDVGSGACEVIDGVVGKPCTVDTEATDCAGVAESHCLDNDFCNTLTGATECDVPGGYCFKFIMGDEVSGTCGYGAWWLDAKTIDPATAAWVCLKCCVTDDDCRKDEGYWCWHDEVSGRGGCVPNDFHEVLDAGTALDGGA